MPEQELLDDFLEALEAAGGPVRNPVPRETLGWPEAQYEEVKAVSMTSSWLSTNCSPPTC
jgi:type I restriction enzyme M protein